MQIGQLEEGDLRTLLVGRAQAISQTLMSGTGNWDDLNKHVAALNEIMGAWGEVRRAQLEQALQAMGGRKVQ